MACDCEASAPTTPGTTGCCSISATVPNGIPVRLEYNNPVGGAAGGVEVPMYRSDAGDPAIMVPTSSQRIWIYFIQLVVGEVVDTNVYYGSSSSAYLTLNSSIVRGSFQANGGIAANLPIIALGLGHRVYVRSAAVTPLDVIAYGVLA